MPRPDLSGILWRPQKTTEIIDRITELPIFSTATRAELEWIVARAEIRSFAAGTAIIEAGTVVREMFVVLTGHVAVYAVVAGGGRRLIDLRTGHVVGALPYSRLTSAPASVVAEEDVQALVIDKAKFPDLMRACPNVTEELVHYMIDRVRLYHGAKLNEDRLQSLGRLAAGLAHELNNPASAATRHALSLAELYESAEASSRAIASARLSDAQLDVLDSLRRRCAVATRSRGALEAADREDDIIDWLERHHIDVRLAEPDRVGEQGAAVARDDRVQPPRRRNLVRREPRRPRLRRHLREVEQRPRRAGRDGRRVRAPARAQQDRER